MKMVVEELQSSIIMLMLFAATVAVAEEAEVDTDCGSKCARDCRNSLFRDVCTEKCLKKCELPFFSSCTLDCTNSKCTNLESGI